MDILLKPSHITYVVSKFKKNFFTSIKVFLAFAKNLATFNHRSFDQKVSVTQITLVYHERSALMKDEFSLPFIPRSGISSSVVKVKAHPLTFLKRGGVLLHLSRTEVIFCLFLFVCFMRLCYLKHIFKAYNLKSLNIFINFFNHQGNEHIHYSKNFPHASLQCLPPALHPTLRQLLICFVKRISLYDFKFHREEFIGYIAFILLSLFFFTQIIVLQFIMLQHESIVNLLLLWCRILLCGNPTICASIHMLMDITNNIAV